MTNYKILVPYDFTEEADCAVVHACALAKQKNGDVVLNHIIDKKTLAKLVKEKRNAEDLTNQISTIASEIAAKHNVPCSAIVREGDIFSTISEIGEEINAALIVFGTHGVKGLQHVLGAFALKLVISAKSPVVIVQRRPIRANGYKKIVFPVDELQYSKQKSFAVAAIAKEHDSEVLIYPKKNSDSGFQNYTNGNVRYAEAVFNDNGVKYTVAVNEKTGSFSKQVMEFAAKNDVDLIAIITQQSGDKDVAEIFLGSDDVKIVNNDAEIPVLCINAYSSLLYGGVNGVSAS